MRKLLREPLLHFMLLGWGLFLLHGWVAGNTSGTGDRIVVTRGRIEQIAAGFERMNQRAPAQDELDGLIEDTIREEILYREAKALGLDQDDTIVRRRLRQKLEFISEDVAPVPEPTESQLLAYMQAHPDRYRSETRYSLSQVYLDPQKHGAQLADAADTLLATLRRDGATQDVAGAGDAFLLPHRYDNVGAGELSRLFGANFETAARALPVDAWHGPVSSGYGVHLVFVHRRDGDSVAALKDVRHLVRRDWIDAQRKQANERFYADLRTRYEIEVEDVDTGRRGGIPALAAETAQ